MFRLAKVSRSAAALVAVALVAACSNNDEVLGPQPRGANAIFQNYVALGNSITAGFQSGGINDSTQRRSYAVLLAGQMGTRFAFPSLAGRGCAPPIANFATQARVGTGSTSTTCDLRNPASATDVLNNLGVPGATVADLTADNGTASSNVLTSLFLGGKTQVEKARDANPTFASIWIGNNDVLAAAVSGVLVPTPGVSPGITSQANFTASYDAIVTQLGASQFKGVLVGVVKVTGAPILFPVASLLGSAQALGGFDQAAGRVPTSTDPFKAAALTIDPNCAAAPTTLISFLMTAQIARFRNDTNPTGQPPKPAANRQGLPPYLACGVSAVPGAPPAPVGEFFVLTPAEQATLNTAVTGYNTFISGKATELNWAFMNPNVLLDSLVAAGQIPAFPNLAQGTTAFG
ncbi:MAG TPA: hypothetical protein VFT29_12155, partial [Gemmatimonadaceae bacterium]|nr:hypothetical protein [Gemmatimonadaceae bacterium]